MSRKRLDRHAPVSKSSTVHLGSSALQGQGADSASPMVNPIPAPVRIVFQRPDSVSSCGSPQSRSFVSPSRIWSGTSTWSAHRRKFCWTCPVRWRGDEGDNRSKCSNAPTCLRIRMMPSSGADACHPPWSERGAVLADPRLQRFICVAVAGPRGMDEGGGSEDVVHANGSGGSPDAPNPHDGPRHRHRALEQVSGCGCPTLRMPSSRPSTRPPRPRPAPGRGSAAAAVAHARQRGHHLSIHHDWNASQSTSCGACQGTRMPVPRRWT